MDFDKQERDALKEKIAEFINLGLDNREIAEELKQTTGLNAKLIALIRDYQMDIKPPCQHPNDYIDDYSGWRRCKDCDAILSQ